MSAATPPTFSPREYENDHDDEFHRRASTTPLVERGDQQEVQMQPVGSTTTPLPPPTYTGHKDVSTQHATRSVPPPPPPATSRSDFAMEGQSRPPPPPLPPQSVSSPPPQHHPYEVLDALLTTTPWSSLSNMMTSYSIANRLMFFPPPPSYGFSAEMPRPPGYDARLTALRGGTRAGAPTRVYIPWCHEHVDGSGRVLGRSPTWMRWAHGISNYITCTRVDFEESVKSVTEPPREPLLMSTNVTFSSAMPRSSSSEEAPASSPSLVGRPPQTNLIGQPSSSASVTTPIGEGGQANEDPGSPQHPPPSASPETGPMAQQSKKRRLVLFFHGNATDCNSDLLHALSEVVSNFHCAATLMLVEYPGYGTMDGEPSAALIKCATERVVQFLFSTSTSELTPDCVTLMAHSMGTGVVMHLVHCITEAFAPLRLKAREAGDEATARQYYVGGIMLSSPFSSIRSVLVPSTDLKFTSGSCGDGGVAIERPSSPTVLRESERRVFEEHYIHRSDALGLFDGVRAYRQFRPPRSRTSSVDVLAPTTTPPATTGGDQNAVSSSSPLDAHWIYRYGSQIILDRFCSFQVAYDMQRRFDCFSHTTLLLIHGVEDDTIPPSHSLRLCMAVAEGDAAAALQPAVRDDSSTIAASNPKAFCLLLSDHDHNNIIGSLSLHVMRNWPLLKKLPGFCPLLSSATKGASSTCAIGMSRAAETNAQVASQSASNPDSPSSPATSHDNCIMAFGNEFLLSSLDAYADSTATAQSLFVWTVGEIVCRVLIGAWLLICGVVHIVAAKRQYDVSAGVSGSGSSGSSGSGAMGQATVPNSHVVMMWAAFECTSWWLSAWVKHMEPRCTLTWRSSSDDGAPSRGACMFYYAMRGLTGALVVSIGVVFGFSCVFSSDVCGSLDHANWDLLTSTVPYAPSENSHAMVTFATSVVKWSMVAAASLDSAQVAMFLMRHH